MKNILITFQTIITGIYYYCYYYYHNYFKKENFHIIILLHPRLHNLGISYYYSGNKTEGLIYFKKAIESEPNFDDSLFWINKIETEVADNNFEIVTTTKNRIFLVF